MILSKILKNTLLVLAACLILTACATKKNVETVSGQKHQLEFLPDAHYSLLNLLTIALKKNLRLLH